MTLQDEFAQWLLDLTLLAGGPSQNLSGKTSGSHEDRLPVGIELDTDPAPWRRRWERCHFREDQEDLIEELSEKVIRFQHASQGNRNRTLEWKIQVARDPRDARVVATVYGVALSTVYKYRKEQKLREAHPDWPEDLIRAA